MENDTITGHGPTIKLMADYFSTGIWVDCHSVDYDDIGGRYKLSYALIARIAAWVRWYECFDTYCQKLSASKNRATMLAFTDEGTRIARQLSKELFDHGIVDYRVEYFNEIIMDTEIIQYNPELPGEN